MTMPSIGELTYQRFIHKLIEKAEYEPYISIKTAEYLGSFFWRLLSEQFKEELTDGRNTFLSFAFDLRRYLDGRCFEEFYGLWANFSADGKEMFENFYDQSLINMVDSIL